MRISMTTIRLLAQMVLFSTIACLPAAAYTVDSRGQPVYSNEAERIEYTRYATDQGDFAGMSKTQLWANRPTFFKFTDWPPRTPETQVMYQWWNAMEKADKSLEYLAEFPINFYGRVVDESNAPVAGAQAHVSWSTLAGTAEVIIPTDTNGLFALTNQIGASLRARIYSDRHYGMEESKGSYNYSEFFARDYHIPDATNPVQFRIWNNVHAEELRVIECTRYIPVDGSTNWVSFHHGGISTSGQFGVSIQRFGDLTNKFSPYRITWLAEVGGGISTNVRNHIYMYQAPGTGYVDHATFLQQTPRIAPGDRTFLRGFQSWFYVVTAATNYAGVEADFANENGTNAWFQCRIEWNPTGSRVLKK